MPSRTLGLFSEPAESESNAGEEMVWEDHDRVHSTGMVREDPKDPALGWAVDGCSRKSYGNGNFVSL